MAHKIQTALVVDDSRLARIALSKQLKKRDIEVEMAGNGTEAVNHLKDSRPDVVFMDFMMPDMDGFEATRQVRALPDGAGVPVVMYTSQDSPEDRARGAELGVIGFLIKPSSEERLDEILQALSSGAAPPAPPAPAEPTERPAPTAAAEPAPAAPAAEIPWDDIRRIAREAAQETADQRVGTAQQEWDGLAARLSKELADSAEQAGRDAAQPLAEKAAAQAVEQRLQAAGEQLRGQAAEVAEQRSRAAAEAMAEQLRAELRGEISRITESEAFRSQVSAVVTEDALPALQQPIVEMTRKLARETAQSAAVEAFERVRAELEAGARKAAVEAAVDAARTATEETLQARKDGGRSGLIAGAIVVAGALIGAAVLLAL